MLQRLESLSEDDIICLCGDCGRYGRSFQKILGNVMVKYGWSVTSDEAANQNYAYRQSLGTKIRVPEVYRYFQRSEIGYLVMEYVDGTPLANFPVDDGLLIQNFAAALYDFTIKTSADFPGPRDHGIPRGHLFSEDGAGEQLDSMDKLNAWLNRRSRLTDSEKRFNFTLADCTFCHLDLSRRNIILHNPSSFCLLDWEYAGFYPREFERYCILFLGQKEDYKYASKLARALDSMYREAGLEVDDNKHMIGLLDRVYQNNLKYHYGSEIQIDWEAVKKFRLPIEAVPH